MSVVRVRFNVDRLNRKLSQAIKFASDGHVEGEYEREVGAVADDISRKIKSSGRGGEHNSEFANYQTRVFESRAGRYNILMGWLTPPEHAKERGGGGRLWYQYQDAGFHLFGGNQWIEGVGATLDARDDMLDAIARVNGRYVHDLARIID